MIVVMGPAKHFKDSELGVRQLRRWVLDMNPFGMEISFQIFHAGTRKWRGVNPYYSVCLTKHFRLGGRHDYYDGPNCGFSLGFLHFEWTPAHCDKCMKGMI